MAIRTVSSKKREEVVNQRLANAIRENKDMDFWSEVKKMGCNKIPYANSVDGHTGNEDICNYFSVDYQQLYNQECQYDVEEM